MIEVQMPSYDVLKKEYSSDIFLRVYVSAFTEGLVAKLKPANFVTFLAICSFMDSKGECYPTQRQIAERTGLSKTTVNRAVKELLEFEIDGRPILQRTILQPEGNSVYTVLPIGQIAIFDQEVEKITPEKEEIVTAAGTFKNGNDILKYYAGVFREVYGVNPAIRWSVDSSLAKKKWIGTHTDEQIRTMIDVSVREFDARWKTAKYPRPTMGAILSWLGQSALAIKEDGDKEYKEIVEMTSDYDQDVKEAMKRLGVTI